MNKIDIFRDILFSPRIRLVVAVMTLTVTVEEMIMAEETKPVGKCFHCILHVF